MLVGRRGVALRRPTDRGAVAAVRGTPPCPSRRLLTVTPLLRSRHGRDAAANEPVLADAKVGQDRGGDLVPRRPSEARRQVRLLRGRSLRARAVRGPARLRRGSDSLPAGHIDMRLGPRGAAERSLPALRTPSRPASTTGRLRTAVAVTRKLRRSR